ncbi:MULTISPECIES: response regulator [Sphingomonas]|jgi:CheY-like chemotaxis protein|uniref:Transcriptional regulator n=2 Tax=Sphingomonas TaxID=13687 RepID=A0A175Y4E4_9SPHN|nr:transcriptional regulator [Sphingomonas sp. NIC1]AOW22650.1 response regulator [Sphingomonas melonis TY]ATI56048.1 response regulator [Sphingomonas melonis]MBI0530672.1 response regulator [Sphingomonas sp. TX0522]MCP4026487.1 response regulator [Sphingomonas sp.]
MMTKTALIVEDEIFVALDLERILVDGGYQVAGIAADAESALQAAPGCGFAFVDVNLRDGPTGPRIAEQIARDYGVKVVFVTANPAQIDCGRDCALGYIRKPFSESAILAAAALAAEGRSPAANDDIVLLDSSRQA